MKYTLELKETEKGCDIIISTDIRNSTVAHITLENDNFVYDKDIIKCMYELLDNTPLTVSAREKEDRELQALLYYIEQSILSMYHQREEFMEREVEPEGPETTQAPTETSKQPEFGRPEPEAPEEEPKEEVIMEEALAEEPKKGSKKKE